MADSKQKKDAEVSEGGSRVFRHTKANDFTMAAGDEQLIAEIVAHVKRHVAEPANVLHEIVSDQVHLDLHVVDPAPNRPFRLLVTSGMSSKPMTVPEGAESFRFAELMIALPPDWPMDIQSFKDERHYWPLRLLKMLARLPHEYNTFFVPEHTIPNGDPAEPLAENTGFIGAMIWGPIALPEEMFVMTRANGEEVHFLTVIPLYQEEMDFKLKKGGEALVKRLADAGVTEVVDIGRVNTCKRKKWFGLF